jgi:hypothetical protein
MDPSTESDGEPDPTEPTEPVAPVPDEEPSALEPVRDDEEPIDPPLRLEFF